MTHPTARPVLPMIPMIAMTLLLTACPAPAPAADGPAKADDPAHSLTVDGVIEPTQLADAMALTQGVVVSFPNDADGKPIDHGSSVKQGAVIAQLDAAPHEAALELQKTRVASAKAELDAARAESTRATRDGKALGAPPAVVHEASRAHLKLAVAEAALAEQQAGLKSLQLNLDRTRILAPISGVVIDRRVNVGQHVGPAAGQSLFLLSAELDRMAVLATVGEADVSRVRSGQTATVTVPHLPGRTWPATVKKVRLNARRTPADGARYTVELALDNPDRALLPYMSARVRIEAPPPKAP